MQRRVSVMIALLVFQFALGMSMNLFAVSPDDSKLVSEPLLIKLIFPAHVIVAVLLLIVATTILVMSVRDPKSRFRKVAGQGLSTIIFAIGGGLATVFLKGNASEVASLTMAMSFLAAFIVYGRFYYLLRGKTKQNLSS